MDTSQYSPPARSRPQSLSLPSASTATATGSISRAVNQIPIYTSISTHALPFPSRSSRRGPTASQPVYSSLRLRGPTIWRWLLVVSAMIVSFQLWHHLRQDTILSRLPLEWRDDPNLQETLRPEDSRRLKSTKKHDPARWLEEHSSPSAQLPNSYTSRPRAAIISLVRNEELEGILQSMRQLEFHWNRNYRYPWIFFSETPFNDEFKAATSNATDAPTYYEIVPREHWATPDWIDTTRYMDSLDYLGTLGVGKGHLLSYHSMIRWNSGFFYRHPALAEYQYYWRVEPDVHFFCDIPYDPFAFLAENELVYGFNMDILDDARSFAGLWAVTREFIAANPELVHPDADVQWLLDPATGLDYNNCQFFSNFEIASLDFFRAEPNQKFFEHLDRFGGFYYSRFGDAPVHTLSLALFAPKDAVWFFRDIGYQHDIARHCPPPSARVGGGGGLCTCEPTGLDENFYKLVPMESPQVKPSDTCIRLWLGGEWLTKKDGWDQEVERAFSGSGYGGYVLDGKI